MSLEKGLENQGNLDAIALGFPPGGESKLPAQDRRIDIGAARSNPTGEHAARHIPPATFASRPETTIAERSNRLPQGNGR